MQYVSLNFLIDQSGLAFFAFQGNVNTDIALNELGVISGEVFRKKEGKWTIQNQRINLIDGDVINYWFNVQVNGTTCNKERQTWTVSCM